MSVHTSDTGHAALKETLHRRKYRSDDHKHPVNVVHHDEATLGERLADKISAGIGSWPFLIVQTVAVAAWMIGNAILFFNFDPKPFILLNLLFSIQAAYTGPVLLLADASDPQAPAGTAHRTPRSRCGRRHQLEPDAGADGPHVNSRRESRPLHR